MQSKIQYSVLYVFVLIYHVPSTFVVDTGTYIRQACGGFGETGTSASYVNQISHLFDCIEMGQSYSFHNGDVTFYNRYVHAPYFRVVHSNLYSLEPAEYDMSR